MSSILRLKMEKIQLFTQISIKYIPKMYDFYKKYGTFHAFCHQIRE